MTENYTLKEALRAGKCGHCGTTAEVAVADLALELFGEESLEYGSYADTRFRWAMTAGVAVGATEVQLNLVARNLLDLPRE